MGRCKVKLELIGNEKSRKLCFKKRKEGLIKKLHQLTTLCDVSACIIISEAASAVNHQEQPPVDIWPPNPEKVRAIIESYYKAKKNISSSSSCRRKLINIGLSDFFRDRQEKIEEELEKLRRKNMEAKYPICHEILNSLTEAQLREFGAALENKAQIVKSRIEFLKMMGTKQLESSTDFAAPKFLNLDYQETTMMDFAAPKKLNLDYQETAMMDFAAPKNLNLDYQETAMMDFAAPKKLNLDYQETAMMDFAAERLGLNHPHKSGANWNIINDLVNENFEEFEFAYSSINGNNFEQCYWENLEEDVFQYNDSLWS